MEEGRADVFPVYRTTAKIATLDVDWVDAIMLPANLRVSAEYGLTQVNGVKKEAAWLKAFILGHKGQAILQSYGFSAP